MRLGAVRHRWSPTWTVALVLVVATGLTAVAARQITVQLRGDSPPSTVAVDRADPAADQTGDPPGVTEEVAALPQRYRAGRPLPLTASPSRWSVVSARSSEG